MQFKKYCLFIVHSLFFNDCLNTTLFLFLQINRIVLSELSRDRNYEIVVVPYNSQGSGPPSPPVAVYVGEAVPTGEPRSVEAEPVSATEVRLRWQAPQENMQNGDLLGYKVMCC